MPNYVISTAPGKTILRNYEGVIATYNEPLHYENVCECVECKSKRNSGYSAPLGDDIHQKSSRLERRATISKD
jgi:lysine 2,3-aminomutase